jgi:MFS family permease
MSVLQRSGAVSEREDDAEPAAKGRIGLPRTFAALAIPDYRMLWFGTLGSFTAMQMSMVARGYLAYALTGSAAMLGLVTFARALPQFFFTLFGGVLADRLPKRNLLLVTQTLTGLAMLTTAVLVHSGAITIWQLMVLGFVEGTIFSFNMPARQALLPELVGQKELMNAVALNNAGMNFTQVFGPALAGLLIATPAVGLTHVFYVMAACYLLPIFTLTKIRPVTGASGRKKAPMIDELKGGLRYIRGHESLAMLLVIGLVPVLLGFSYQSLLPVFASDDVLGVGASGLGLLSAAVGLGALIGSLAIASYNDFRRRGMAQLAMGAAWGVTLIFFGMAPGFMLALVALVLVGFTASAYRSLNSTLITGVTDPRFYGRVMSVQMLGFSASMLTPLPVGFIVDRIGAPATVAINGMLITLFIALTATLVSSYRRLELAPAAERPAVRAAGPG